MYDRSYASVVTRHAYGMLHTVKKYLANIVRNTWIGNGSGTRFNWNRGNVFTGN